MAKLTKADAARQLGIARSPLYKMIDQGKVSPTADGLLDQAELVRVAAYVDTLKERTRTSADKYETPIQRHAEIPTERPRTDVREQLWTDTSERMQTSADALVDILRGQIQILRDELQEAREERHAAREREALLLRMVEQMQQRYDRLLDAPRSPVLRNNSILIALDDNSRSKDNSQGLQILLQRDTLAMTRLSRLLSNLILFAYILLTLVVDAARFLWLCLRSPTTLAAENLFLRKQLALYQERHVTPRRTTNATRLALVWLGRWFDWRQAVTIVQPTTFIRWHRQGFCLFWRWKSRPGRPSIPVDLPILIRCMARENPTWGQERIANELRLKLGLRVSPRTIRKYLPKRLNPGRGKRATTQGWQTFVRNHAQAIIACDFCVVVTATFRLLYVFVLMEHATRRILHVNVTTHPTSPWTLQQLREAIPVDHTYRFLLHDRDSIFSAQLDRSIQDLGLRVLKTPPQSPQANALCERLLGTLRRECLDYLIPLSENHLRRILTLWVPHYNAGRPHMSLGPGIPQPPPHLPVPVLVHRHRLPEHLRVVTRPILGGLHHEYHLAKVA